MKPLIGITAEFRPKTLGDIDFASHSLLASYTEAIKQAGGLPVILPIADETNALSTLARLDGLLLTGDTRDIPPQVIDQDPHATTNPTTMTRWNSDTLWLSTARELGTPILAICFGMQLLNVAEGGTLHQDIPDCIPGAQKHTTPELDLDHPVTIEQDSLLASMAPEKEVTVRSTHHQAIAEPPPDYRITARAPDGIIEAIEHTHEAFILGVQWHPELAPQQPNWLIQSFIAHCQPGAPH